MTVEPSSSSLFEGEHEGLSEVGVRTDGDASIGKRSSMGMPLKLPVIQNPYVKKSSNFNTFKSPPRAARKALNYEGVNTPPLGIC